MSALANRRNCATIERLAKEILTQCAHYRRNREEENGLRFLLIRQAAGALEDVAVRAARRYEREHPL